MKDIREVAFNEGVDIGKEQAKIEIAINLLNIFNNETISETCELSIYKVQHLRSIKEMILNEGKEASKIQIAINLLDILNDEAISERCDLSIDKVQQLRNENKND